jgi:hypothetical protein
VRKSRVKPRHGGYGVFVRYPGGDVQAQNTLNVQ